MCAVTLRLSITASDDVRKTVPRAHRAGATCASSHLARVPCARAGPRLTPARASRFRDREGEPQNVIIFYILWKGSYALWKGSSVIIFFYLTTGKSGVCYDV